MAIDNLEELGKRLKEIRRHYNLTQKEIAERAGVFQSIISRAETGKELGGKNFLLLINFYSLYVNLDHLFADDFELLVNTQNKVIKDIHLDSIVTEQIEHAQTEVNKDLENAIAQLKHIQTDTIKQFERIKKITNI